MAQLSIFIDDKTLRKVEMAAKEDKKSISRWVSETLTTNMPLPTPLTHNIDVDSVIPTN